MVFSNEEKQIWQNSEVMREFERIAKEKGLETPNKAYLPIKLGEDWEEETDEEKLLEAIKEFEEEEKDIEKQRENEIEFDEEKIMPPAQHDVELSGVGEEGDLDPADEDFLDNLKDYEEQEKRKEYNEGEVRPWDWRGTINPIEIEANLISNLKKLASYLGSQGKVVEAFKIEDAIRDIKLEAKNNG